MEVGTLLEDLVARIFAKKTGLKIYRRKCMFQHPAHPWMLADLDFLVEMPDGSTAILECKTTNYNARNKWEYDGKPIVPVYYESQGRHYMAVMNLNRVYYCCLYGNNEEEVIIRHIDRDMDYESELISPEEDFWLNHVQAQVPPPYFEDDGELILESLRRLMGPSSKDAPPVLLTPPQSAKMFRFLELQAEKKRLDAESNRLKAEMDRMKALIVADMGSSCTAVYEDASGSYTVTFNPSYKESILKDNLLRLKTADLMIPEDARSPYTFGDHLIRFTAVGYDLPQTDSIKMELEGTWTKGKYGCQLQVDRWHEIVPPTIEGIRGYLSPGLLKGIGEKTADAIIQRFGIQSLYILEHQPDKLLEIRGITEERLDEIKAGYAESKAMRDIMTLLAPFKVTPTTAMKIYEHFGPDGVELLRKSPFRLACPNGRMCLNPLRITDQMAIFEARLYANREDNASLLASFTSTQMAQNVPGGLYIRAAQNEALNEALDNAGFGIQLCDVAQVSDGSGCGSEIPLSQVEAYLQTTTSAGTPIPEEPAKSAEPAAAPVEKAAEEPKPAETSKTNVAEEPAVPVQAAPEEAVVPASDQKPADELPAGEATETVPAEEAPASQEEVTGVGTPSAPENVTVLPMTSHTELDAEAENGENADHAADAQSGYTDDMTVEEICERMTMDEARDILVPLGTCKGWTLGQVLDRRPTSLRWYMVDCQDASNILKAGATLLWNYRQTQKAG